MMEFKIGRKMKIENDHNRITNKKSLKKKSQNTGSTSFDSFFGSINETSDVAKTSQTNAPAATLQNMSILSLQEHRDPAEILEKSHKNIKKTINDLKKLRIELLSYGKPIEKLQQIQKEIAQTKENLSHVKNNKELKEIINEIEILLEVEIAKEEMLMS